MRILTSILALGLAAAAVFAQDIVITSDGNAVANGATVRVGYEKGGTSKKARYEWNPKLAMTMPATGEATIMLAVEDDPGLGVTTDEGISDNVQCCAPDNQCEFMSGGFLVKNTLPGSPLQAGVATNMLIERVYAGPVAAVVESEIKTCTVNVTITSPVANDFSFSIEFVAAPASEVGGIQAVVSDEQYVNVSSNNSLHYNLASATVVKVYDAAGMLVHSARVSGNGYLSLSHLPAGVYLFAAGNYSGKIAVK